MCKAGKAKSTHPRLVSESVNRVAVVQARRPQLLLQDALARGAVVA
jgi:hypothetical protein